MGPTNIALVNLFRADNRVRAAQAKLDEASKGVRLQERRVADLSERLTLASTKLRDQQSATANLELDLKSREARIERLRAQQQGTKNNREYQTFLIEINTEKVDRQKVEDETLKAMEQVEKLKADVTELTQLQAAEGAKLQTLKDEIGDKLAALQAEVDALKPARVAALQAVPPRARQAFERLADRFEGEALSALSKPDRRREQYVCTACNMDLVVDVYNKLHARDDLVFCPSCHRILYIPDDLPPEAA
ncbi:MAG TPA: C4-type zinc ribbon domain-containing protein, partial [Tepidisphaeraceae bacterium]|nr:C4-type zinc ribbon domain-containing protein [Tepidisphaeraceae bacterium]